MNNRINGTDVKPSVNGKAKTESEEGMAPEYEVIDGGMVHWARDQKNRPFEVKLTNFTAQLVRNRVLDDGEEPILTLDIDATLEGRTVEIRGLPAAEFSAMTWPIEYLGGGAIIHTGKLIASHAREAIQTLSGTVPTVTAYTHLGWRRVDGEWCYLHSGGAIGATGPVDGVNVAAGDKFARFVLPDPTSDPDKLRKAVTEAFRLLRVAPNSITAALFAAVCRAPLGAADFSVHLVGPTGVGKTVLAALAQQFWGAELDWQRCPASWSSTSNANEGLRFITKDTLLLLDDLSPGSASPRDIDRTFRAQANGSGRDRMRVDSSIRTTKYPRRFLISTGEDAPLNQSAAARVLVVRVGPGDVEWARVAKRQAAADAGRLALALAGYVQWLAQQLDSVFTAKAGRVAELRAAATGEGGHKRTPGIFAELLFGVETFLRFAREIGAINLSKADAFRTDIEAGLLEAADAQTAVQREADPVVRFGELLTGALTSGRAHVVADDGKSPHQPAAWGWRHGEPQGAKIGWLVGTTKLFLEPEATYQVLAAMSHDIGGALLTQRTLWQRLHERGLLATTDDTRETLKVRQTLEGVRRNVLHFAAGIVLGKPDETDVEQ